MYTLYNPAAGANLMWPQQQIPMAGQVYYAPMPANNMPAAYLLNGAPAVIPVGHHHGQPPVFYHPQAPADWFPSSRASNSSSSDDDVFLNEPPPSSQASASSSARRDVMPAPVAPRKRSTKVVECQTDESCFQLRRASSKSRRKLANASLPNSSSSNGSPTSSSDNSLSNSNSSSRTTSPILVQQGRFEEGSGLDATKPPFVPSSRISARQTRLNNDLTLYDVFSASLCSAINEDPHDPRSSESDLPPRKTSSPIPEENSVAEATTATAAAEAAINVQKLKNAQNRFLASVSSERCLRFSQNGWEVDLENEAASDAHNCTLDLVKDPIATRREDFLKILEQERENQRKCVLPKYAPKMNCKFCKNNGEPAEVYTKHRLHFNEKTVCPLLRHYVCRLCNSTGDFAHTIRHCPFNTRYDSLAWKATFL